MGSICDVVMPIVTPKNSQTSENAEPSIPIKMKQSHRWNGILPFEPPTDYSTVGSMFKRAEQNNDK